MALRLKTRFRTKGPKTIEDRASVVAFNLWKIAQEATLRMEKEGFRFASDVQIAAVMTELIAFLVQVADRIVHGQLSEPDRGRFIGALGRRLADTMQSNLSDMLGPDDHAGRFIAALNARGADYAECEYGARGPGYAFLRVLGEKVHAAMAGGDNKWAVEHVMEIAAPEAVRLAKKLVGEVLGVKVA